MASNVDVVKASNVDVVMASNVDVVKASNVDVVMASNVDVVKASNERWCGRAGGQCVEGEGVRHPRGHESHRGERSDGPQHQRRFLHARCRYVHLTWTLRRPYIAPL